MRLELPRPEHLYVQQLGQVHGPFSLDEIRAMVKSRALRRDTMVQIEPDGLWFPMGQVPGLFSERDWGGALAISWTIGWFGIDRFYLGYWGLGFLKLFLTLSGFVVWMGMAFVGAFSMSGDDSAFPAWIALGYIPYGIAFIWHAADVIRITTRRLPDADGYPLL